MIKWKGDNLHIDSDINKSDGYDMFYNFIVTERESGKTTLMVKKFYMEFIKSKRPSILVRRFQADITESYIDSLVQTINHFTEQRYILKYSKSEVKSAGIIDIFLFEDNKQVYDIPIIRVIALNTPLSRLKSQRLDRVRYIFFDEFICNKRARENYLEQEFFLLKEGIINTYKRFCDKKADGSPRLNVYFFGNPYSLFNPYFMDLKIDTNKLYPGAFIAEKNYLVWCYQIKPELKEQLLRSNPLYQFDDAYKKYAFDGRAVQDADIKLMTKQPDGFKLTYIFKLHGKYIGIYKGYQFEPEKLFYWSKLLSPAEISNKRDIICFDFGDMADRTMLMYDKKIYYSFKEAIQKRWIAFYSTEESWLIEEIYQEL